MESIIKHYQVAHVGFSLSYPDSSQEMMAVLLEAYQAFECDEQVASAALTSFSLTLNESGEELRKPPVSRRNADKMRRDSSLSAVVWERSRRRS